MRTGTGAYVRSPTSWLRFLAGFAVLYAVLAATSAVDATGRWGLAILAAVLVPAGLLEFARTGGTLTTVLRRLGLARPGGGHWRQPPSRQVSSCSCTR